MPGVVECLTGTVGCLCKLIHLQLLSNCLNVYTGIFLVQLHVFVVVHSLEKFFHLGVQLFFGLLIFCNLLAVVLADEIVKLDLAFVGGSKLSIMSLQQELDSICESSFNLKVWQEFSLVLVHSPYSELWGTFGCSCDKLHIWVGIYSSQKMALGLEFNDGRDTTI